MPSTRSILLVEEDAVCRGFLADNLTADGYDVIVAVDKAAALAQLEARRPTSCSCDVNGETLDADRRRPRRRRARLADRPDDAADRAHRHAGRADARPLPRARRRRRPPQAVLTTASCSPASAPCCAAPHEPPAGPRRPRRRAAHRHARPAPCTSPAPRRARGQGVRAARAPRRRADARLHQGRAAARRLGLPQRAASPARSTAHALRLRRKLRAAGEAPWVENVWGVGYRLAPVGTGDGVRDAA